MEKNKASVTSLVSAFSRAYHSEFDTPKIFDDFLAKTLITEQEYTEIRENMLKGISFFNQEIAEKFQDQPDEILKWITQVQLSPTPLARAAYCEKVLFHETWLGVKQYVILGAGLDTFCFRYPNLIGNLKIFEVDFPATQEFKKNRLESANFTPPEHLHFVPMDFTQEFTVQNLVEQGFRQEEKTIFSLLGVSYYLTKEELECLLHTLFSQIPSGSSIVFDYADERLFEETGLSNRVQNMLNMAKVAGEPMKSCFSYEDMEKMLENAGLLIYEHLAPEEIQQQFFLDRNDYLAAFETVQFIHAVKK
jgi:methyltransferase (TIGR00027 family)